MKVLQSMIIAQLILGLLLTYLVSFGTAFAEELPSREAIETQIKNNAQENLEASQHNSHELQVTNTGDTVSTEQNTEANTLTDVNNTNTTEVNQQVNAEANTGNNEASKNISFGGNAGMITTGNAGVAVSNQTNANNNTTYIDPSAQHVGNNAYITNSGNGLYADTSSQNTRNTNVRNSNSTYINQGVQSKANTGGNKADGNISIGGLAGVIHTGDAFTNVDFLVTANGSVVLVGGSGDGFGPGSGASIFLLNTGDNSRFLSSADRNSRTSVQNSNDLTVTQHCGYGVAGAFVDGQLRGCSADTGNNNSSRNIGYGTDAGVIQTGDAVVAVSTEVEGNTNSTQVQNSSTGNGSETDVVNTGDNAHVANNSSSNTETTVNNSNSAHLNQNVNAYANTGNNIANRNISFGGDAGIIQTGNAYVLVDFNANVNKNGTTIAHQSSELSSNRINTNTHTNDTETDIPVIPTPTVTDTSTKNEATTRQRIIPRIYVFNIYENEQPHENTIQNTGNNARYTNSNNNGNAVGVKDTNPQRREQAPKEITPTQVIEPQQTQAGFISSGYPLFTMLGVGSLLHMLRKNIGLSRYFET